MRSWGEKTSSCAVLLHLDMQPSTSTLMEAIVPVKCAECGYLYIPDDPETMALHAERHEEITSPDRPTPDSRVAGLADPGSGLIIFERSDPDFLHEKLYGIARRFQREMGYDKADWAPKGRQVVAGAIGAIFSDDEGRALGGAGIYYKPTQYRDVSHMIGWIWIAPDHRRKGVFARAVPDLATRFDGALLQFPYSEAMTRFAERSRYIVGKRNGPGPLYLKQATL